MKPKRIQLKRTEGFRLPPNTVIISRPSKWGNPFRVSDGLTQQEAKEAFEQLMETGGVAYCNAENAKCQLRGKNLACWCKIGTPCHADVLLKIANS